MAKKNSLKKALITSALSMVLCSSMFVGTTYAWFTDSVTSGSNIIQTGNLDIVMEYWDGDSWENAEGKSLNFKAADGRTDILWEPGCTYELPKIRVRNEGNLTAYVLLRLNGVTGNEKLMEAITLKTKVENVPDSLKTGSHGQEYTKMEGSEWNLFYGTPDGTVLADWSLAPKGKTTPNTGHTDTTAEFTIYGHMKEEAGNEYKDLKIEGVSITALATQAVYEYDSFGRDYDEGATLPVVPVADEWDGTADTSWYNDTDTEFTLSTAEAVAGLASLVDDGNTFEGKTIKLNSDFDLYAEDENGELISFEPIGSLSDEEAFKGTFDGQGHTISNLYQNGWVLQNGYWDGPEYGMGFFSLVEKAVIKNVNFDGASLPSEANIMGVVAGGAADSVFENINITDAYLGNHSWYSGGVIGWAEGEVKLINCDIDANSVVSSQWGDFNNANGGLIGAIDSESTIYLKDCDVACVIDAYNDVTSAYEWYSYRSCGMLIGDTGRMDDPDGNNVGNAIAPNLTCVNVTVTYGDWANYHYCEFGSSNYPFCRVEAGESTGAYGNARVGEYTDANGNKVVDDNHIHNDGEKHNELIVFDQLYGGESGDRYCTYGTATHDGVTVIYNNK